MIQRESDVSSVSLTAQVKSFNRVFWIGNAIEMFERLAYYGLRTVLPIYMVLSVAEGGPEFTHTQKGSIFAIWAAVQSFVPVFTGGFADRYGFKLTVGISIAVKVVGYLIMAFAIELASFFTGGASLGVPGHSTVMAVFIAGAIGLAGGTAIFKPGIQGIIAHQLRSDNASTGWAVFYQLVNVGGFIGPFLAAYMRLLDWKYVFISCAAIVCINYVLLLTFAEPEQEGVATVAPNRSMLQKIKDGGMVLWHSGIGICEPRLMGFLVVFSGFWMMFYQLFDLLPNFIDDWVDSSMVLTATAAPVMAMWGATPPAEWGGMMPQEQMINLNAGMIMILAFAVGFLTGKMRSMTAMALGILVSAAAIYSFSFSMNGWLVVAGIALFSIGEMFASPTKMRYFTSIAPPGKKGLYLGYVNATTGIGWALGSDIAGKMYDAQGDKVNLARRHLVDAYDRSETVVSALPKDSVIPALAEAANTTVNGARELLWATYSPGDLWIWFAQIGVISMVGLLIFDQITRRSLKQEAWALVALVGVLSALTYGLQWAALFSGMMVLYMFVEAKFPNALDRNIEAEG